jgi:hypothetical protein
MPNWWLRWAERISLALAELWLRSRPRGAGEDPTPPPEGRSSGPAPEAPVCPPPHPDSGLDSRPE